MKVPFPIPDIASEPELAPFYEYATKGEIRLPKRKDTGTFDWYPSGAEVEWVTISGKASVFSWAVVNQPIYPGYAGLTPFVSALVEPVEAPGVRIVTRLVGNTHGLQIGDAVTVEFEDVGAPGIETGVIGPRFRVYVS